MALMRSSRRSGVRRGRGVQLGRRVQLELTHGGELILGDRCRIGDRTRIVVQGGRVEIGAGAVLGERCTIVAHERVTIGADARLQDGAVMVDFDHVVDDVELPIRAQPLVCSPIEIGEGARIGLGAGVLRGVSVGAGAVVGPHAVVTRDVAAGAAVGGVPARPLDDRDG
ncbi:MAG: acyltransferase [Thermoleophilia bacterium]